MDELALTIGYVVLYVLEVCLGIWLLSAVITGLMHAVGWILRRR